MDQFVQRAAENFELTIPTWQMVEKLQKEESDRVAAARKKEMEEKLQKAKQARAENEKKRKAELADEMLSPSSSRGSVASRGPPPNPYM